MKTFVLLVLCHLLSMGFLPQAGAVRMRRPFAQSVGVNYGFDNNYGAAGCLDYGCGTVCYDGHSGTDFPLPVGTQLFAVAAGRVTATYNSCPNYGSLGDTCGGRCGNYVRIDHLDGTVSLFCHMQRDSIVVANNENVVCGQYVGNSASSGSSTGPHLHLGFRLNGTNIDPFTGSCSQPVSYWMNQGTYPRPIPSTECETPCECTPGHVETEPCCDCGTRSRTCSSTCQWSGWSSCAGPDPDGGNTPCDTGEQGPCAEGRIRCHEGCIACVRLHPLGEEVCDGTDNDCNGLVDDGFPETLGDPPPAMAARLLDIGVPQSAQPGERIAGWAVFENVGSATWPAGDTGLRILPDTLENPENWSDPTWPETLIPVLLAEDVLPGERTMFEFAFVVPLDANQRLAAELQVFSTLHGPALCPSPLVQLHVPVYPGDSHERPKLVPNQAKSGCSCRAGTQPLPEGLPLMLVLPLLLFLRRRRDYRSSSAMQR